MVASLGHPELMLEEKKMLKKVWSYPVDFCIRFRTIPDNPYIECYRALRYTDNNPYTLPCSLACAGNSSFRIQFYNIHLTGRT